MFSGIALFVAALIDPIRLLISFIFSFAFLNLKKPLSKILFVIFATATLGIGFAVYNNEKAFMYDKSQFGEVDKDYTPFDVVNGTIYETYWRRFAGANNLKETAYIKKLVSQRIKDCEILMGTVGCDEKAFKIKRTITSLLVSLCHILLLMWLYNYWVGRRPRPDARD